MSNENGRNAFPVCHGQVVSHLKQMSDGKQSFTIMDFMIIECNVADKCKDKAGY